MHVVQYKCSAFPGQLTRRTAATTMFKTECDNVSFGPQMKFGNLRINPAKNPAVLDTGTWDSPKAWSAISAVDDRFWTSLSTTSGQDGRLPPDGRLTVHAGSVAQHRESLFFLLSLDGGQHVFVELGKEDRPATLTKPIGSRSLQGGGHLIAYATDAAAVERYVSIIRPDKGPRSLGAAPRLGIGSRMTTAAWPGVWSAMKKGGFRANPIQNSVREVNLLDDLLAAQPQRLNYMANFGRVPEGHAGSTFEGLWVAGVLEALKSGSSPEFGADADHITVRRGDADINRARKVIESARYYTFFTLDVSDLLDYGAMNAGSEAEAEDYTTRHIGRSAAQRELTTYHSQQSKLNKSQVGRLIGKYWPALDAVEQLAKHIEGVRDGKPFDLELSIDETPAGIDTFDCLTSEDELSFLANEIRRRHIPVTHIAPNFGIEKELDYRGRDGLTGLEKRMCGLQDISRKSGIMLDCHSGDDLKPATRRAVGRATKGQIHFKVSPALQIIFAETVNDVVPERFCFWWNDTLDYAHREAEAGSDFAAECLRKYNAADDQQPSPEHAVFHYYNFASVGKRDERGQFIHREKFYDLPVEFYREYQNRICRYLCEVAADVQMS